MKKQHSFFSTPDTFLPFLCVLSFEVRSRNIYLLQVDVCSVPSSLCRLRKQLRFLDTLAVGAPSNGIGCSAGARCSVSIAVLIQSPPIALVPLINYTRDQRGNPCPALPMAGGWCHGCGEPASARPLAWQRLGDGRASPSGCLSLAGWQELKLCQIVEICLRLIICQV